MEFYFQRTKKCLENERREQILKFNIPLEEKQKKKVTPQIKKFDKKVMFDNRMCSTIEDSRQQRMFNNRECVRQQRMVDKKKFDNRD